MGSKGIENHSRGEKGNKTAQPNVTVYWTINLEEVSGRPSMPCLCQFQIKFPIGNAGAGALEWFVQMANKCSDYWRKKADLGGQ
jgi:hypothetical protein